MRDHYRSPITNRQLARLAHMSVRAFEREFQGSFHLTPQKYLRKLPMLNGQPGPGLHPAAARGRGRGLRLLSRTRRRRRRSYHKTCRWRAIFDLADAVTIRPLGRSRWGTHSGAGTCGNAYVARPAAIGDRAKEQ
jgi:hypothetical protein